MTLDRTLQIIQVAYPQVYLACHTRHQRKRTTTHRLSARDSSILAHLHRSRPLAPALLATHLSISRSTLSEALKRLTQLEYVSQIVRPSVNGARGGRGVLLTEKGAQAMEATSVLEAPRLRSILAELSSAELKAVERGMRILANACVKWSANVDEAKEGDA